MELHNLKPAQGATKNNKRIGRGQGSGRGGTSTRGHKGAKSRSGYSNKRNFEGGQMPLQMRLPKRGFKNPNRVEYVAINLGRLQKIVDKYKLNEVSPEILYTNGIIKKRDRIKILGNGEMTSKLNITAHACSKTAQQAVEGLGGSITIL